MKPCARVLILILPFFLAGCLVREIMVAPYQGQATRDALAASLHLEIALEPKTISLASGADGMVVLRLTNTSAQRYHRYHPEAAYVSVLQGAQGVECSLLSPPLLWAKSPANQIWEWHFDEAAVSGDFEVQVHCRFTASGIYAMEGGIYLSETQPASFGQYFSWEVVP